MKKFLSLLLVLAMVLSCGVTVFADETETGITILYTNDIHSYIDKDITYSLLAAYKDSLGEDVLLVDAGDAIQGCAYGSMDNGETVIKLMNAAGYDLATLGNHEFDYKMEGRIKVTDEWAEFPYVSCNFYNEKDGVVGDSVLDSYKIFVIGGKKIAFVGITTPESFSKSTPKYFQDDNGNYIYGIAGGTDGAALYAAVQNAIDAATAEGADYIIALGHLGIDESSKPWTSEDVIANTTGLDAFIDGHSHTSKPQDKVTDKGGNSVILTQAGEYFGAIGQMTITEEGIATKLVTAEDLADITPDTEVKAIEDAWIKDVDTQLGEVIGSVDFTFDNYDADGNRLVRKQETNTGNFCADALYYLFDNLDYDVDVAIMNGGGIRNKAITGEISYLTCKQIHTFGNIACLQIITGQQLLDALEFGARQTPDVEVGGFLHVSGVKYTVDASIESTVQMDDKANWIGGPTGEYRVKDVMILQDGEYVPLDLEAKYNLAGYNYTLRDLGDGFTM
ncbi:MAG: bifunctional metallophosphatase/5'-nucleotidase, partial [Oscillospiraceae bacterium]|nr:bifunctional metallophosphatase/5'-nucleotidase [Oscillospiraceae bacterium]